MKFYKFTFKSFLLSILFLGLFGSSLFSIDSGTYRIKRTAGNQYLTWNDAGDVSLSASNNTNYQKWTVVRTGEQVGSLVCYFIKPYGVDYKFLSAKNRTRNGQTLDYYIEIEQNQIGFQTILKGSPVAESWEKWGIIDLVSGGRRIRSLRADWSNTCLGQGGDVWVFELVS